MTNRQVHQIWIGISLFSLILGFATGGCGDSYAAKGARDGATVGAISGAVGGLVSGLVFGGDPVERAARGAVYGGTTGAVAGGIGGSRADKRVKEQQKDDLEQLRKEIGEDSFLGLTALAECRHEEALNYAGQAQKTDNPNYALAGLWLEILTYADQRHESQARKMFPKLVEMDWDIKSESQAEATMRDTLNELMDLREEYGLARVCP
ncbi:hypothetical protein ACFL6U_17530 [Planctomycetota bacterium]